jgi:hypothetical protein
MDGVTMFEMIGMTCVMTDGISVETVVNFAAIIAN